jgi:glycerophosphoryl diester phosphodiesterase
MRRNQMTSQMQPTMRRGRLVALVAVLLMGPAACGGDDAPAATEPAPATAAPDTAAPATAAPDTTAAPTTAAPSTVPPTTAAPLARDGVTPPEASTVADLLALDRPIVIAHAGGDFEAPHSTMYAFTQAALVGTDVLEMDVMLTADRQLVVHHDDTVDRTTEATGPVRELTYEQLSALDNAYWFSGDVWSDQSLAPEAYAFRGMRTGDAPPPAGYTPDDFRVETFRSVATAFPDHVLDVEIKIPNGADGQPDLAWAYEGAKELAAEIDELGRTDSVIVVSFDTSVLEAFRAVAPDVATSPGLDTLVTWYTGGEVTFAASDKVFQVPPFYGGVEVLTADVVARAQAEGFAVWVWMDDTATQETADFYQVLLDRNVDGLLVSRPAVATELLGTDGV